MAGSAWAQDVTGVREPTTTEGGGPLVSLDACSVVLTPRNAAFAPQTLTYPASSQTGGGDHMFDITDEIPGIQGIVDVSATCTNLGGESDADTRVATFSVLRSSPPALLP
jgi:hypothetical protein